MLFDKNNRRKTKSPFQATFDDLIEEFGERAEFASATVDDSIAGIRPDKKTGVRTFTTQELFDAFWPATEGSEFFDLFYHPAVAFVGDEEEHDSIWQHAYHLYGLLVWSRIVADKGEGVYSDNFDRKKDCYYETMNKRYTERSAV